MTPPSDPVSVELLAADSSFFSALLERNQADLTQLLGQDFVIVDVSSGSVATRSQFLAAIDSGAVAFTQIRTFPDEALVRHYGDIGLVVSRTEMSFSLPDGSSYTGESRYTHVFLSSDGRWRLVSAQGTPIVE